MFAMPKDWDEDCTRYFKDMNGNRVESGTPYRENTYYENPYYGVKRTIVSMGAYLVIFPDKRFINTVDFSDKGNLEVEIGFDPNFMGELPPELTFSPCDQDGSAYEQETYRLLTKKPDDWDENYNTKYYTWDWQNEKYILYNETAVWNPNMVRFVYEKAALFAAEKPPHPLDGDIWIDNSNKEQPVTRKYSSTMQMWTAVSSVYFKIESKDSKINNFSTLFHEGDTIQLEGCGGLDGDYNIVKTGENYLVVAGVLSSQTSISGVVIKRTCPDMDFVIEGENRLWGCRYGISSKTGEFVNEIYACKLGDFKNWYTYAGISTDAYAVSLGSDGAFTGAVFYAGYPTFFKERYIHRITGNVPANYCLYTTVCDGVQAGSGKSLAVVNGNLIYKSPTGIMTYTGNYPSTISSVFADEMYDHAVAGEVGSRYYVSMSDKNGVYRLFVFDAEKGLWHIEDNTQAQDFARVGHVLYCMCDDCMFTMSGDGAQVVEWYAQSGIQEAVNPDQSYVTRINIRASLDSQAYIDVYIEYDSDGKWERVFHLTGTDFTSKAISILPRRCDHYALRMEGRGECKIYSITRTLERGSDERW